MASSKKLTTRARRLFISSFCLRSSIGCRTPKNQSPVPAGVAAWSPCIAPERGAVLAQVALSRFVACTFHPHALQESGATVSSGCVRSVREATQGFKRVAEHGAGFCVGIDEPPSSSQTANPLPPARKHRTQVVRTGTCIGRASLLMASLAWWKRAVWLRNAGGCDRLRGPAILTTATRFGNPDRLVSRDRKTCTGGAICGSLR